MFSTTKDYVMLSISHALTNDSKHHPGDCHAPKRRSQCHRRVVTFSFGMHPSKNISGS